MEVDHVIQVLDSDALQIVKFKVIVDTQAHNGSMVFEE